MNEIKINKVVKSKMGGCLAAERHGDVLMWRPGGPLSIKTCPTAQLMPNNRPELCKRDVEMAFGSWVLFLLYVTSVLMARDGPNRLVGPRIPSGLLNKIKVSDY